MCSPLTAQPTTSPWALRFSTQSLRPSSAISSSSSSISSSWISRAHVLVTKLSLPLVRQGPVHGGWLGHMFVCADLPDRLAVDDALAQLGPERLGENLRPPHTSFLRHNASAP